MNKQHHLFWAIGFVLIFIALQVISEIFVTIGYAIYLHHIPDALPPLAIILYMFLFSVAGIILFWRKKWVELSPRYLKSRPVGVFLWCIIAAIGAIIPSTFLQESLPEWPESIQKYVDMAEVVAAQLMSTTGGYFIVCLLAPVTEEIVFRGAVLRTLLAWKPERRWLMITLSALLFMLAHMNPAQMIHPFLIGLLLGWMYERTGSILPGIIYHWANNTVAYLMFRAYPSTDLTLSDILGGSEKNVLMAVGFSLLILIPAIMQLNMRMKKK